MNCGVKLIGIPNFCGECGSATGNGLTRPGLHPMALQGHPSAVATGDDPAFDSTSEEEHRDDHGQGDDIMRPRIASKKKAGVERIKQEQPDPINPVDEKGKWQAVGSEHKARARTCVIL